MNKDLLEIEVDCHNDASEDFAEIRWIKLPEPNYLLYALPDKPDDMYPANEFKTLVEKSVKFKRSPELAIIVINKTSGNRRAIPFLLKWPDDQRPGVTLNKFSSHITIP
jgi:hypothetical protein